jgi:hypothetical protein
MPRPTQEDAQLPRGDAIRHPVKHVKHEAEHLHEVANAGESAETPLILIAGIVLVLTPIAALWIWAVLSLYNSAV